MSSFRLLLGGGVCFHVHRIAVEIDPKLTRDRIARTLTGQVFQAWGKDLS
jgi:hypothetical protein